MSVILFILLLVPGEHCLESPTSVSANSGQELTIPCGGGQQRGPGGGQHHGPEGDQQPGPGGDQQPGPGGGQQPVPAHCQWTKDGFGLGTEPELSGWPRYSLEGCNLHVDPVLPVDDGEYRCQAFGDGQTKSSIAIVMLSVHVQPGPPSIDQARLEDVMVVKEGQEIELVCQTQGAKPPAQITWNKKNGQFILSEAWKNVTRMGGLKTFKTMSKLKFTAKENMNITCSAHNEGFPQPRISRALEIKIKHLPRIQMELSDSKVKEGESLEARCFSAPHVQDLKYTWFVNEDKVEEHSEGVLRIEKVDKKHDQANIKCLAENEDGQWEISKMLNVDFSPKIRVHPTDQLAQIGEKVVFRCEAEGSPHPKYIWFKGKSLELVGDSQNLSLTATDDAESDYVCHVLTEGHQTVVSDTARLKIKRKPKILKQRPKLGILGKDIILECAVESFTDNKIVWTKENEPIDSTGDKYQVIGSKHKGVQLSHLIIFKLGKKDFSDYGCFASNEVGTDYRKISLNEEKEVDFLAILICSNVVLIIFISLGCFLYRHTKGRRDKKDQIYKKENPIYKNADTSIFDELLAGNKKDRNQDSIEIRQNLENMNLVSDNNLM